MSSADLFSLTGRKAIVTGGGTHIGKAIAEALAGFGAEVHIAGRRFEVCEAAAQELRLAGLSCTPHRCDAADEDEVEALLDAVAGENGDIHIMVCNAGAAEAGTPAPYIEMSRWESTIRAGLTTAAVTAQAAARRMIESGVAGRIILLGSIHGILGADARIYAPGFPRSGADYHAAKGAIINLTRSLACELGHHAITVNCISPGQIPLPNADPDTVERFRRANPLARTGTPRDLQGVAVLLASDAGAFITGENIVVDGGWSAW